jgi:hypothetical protein
MLSLFRPRVAASSLRAVRPTSRYLTYKQPSADDEAASEAKIHSKDDLSPRSKESTRSGTNDEIAGDNSAYNPRTTNPVAEKSETGAEVGCERSTIAAAAAASSSSSSSTPIASSQSFTGSTHQHMDYTEQPDYSNVEWPPHFGTSVHMGSTFSLYGV